MNTAVSLFVGVKSSYNFKIVLQLFFICGKIYVLNTSPREKGIFMKYTNLTVIPMPKEVIGEKADASFDEVLIPARLCSVASSLHEAGESLLSFVKKVHGVELGEGEGGMLDLRLLATILSNLHQRTMNQASLHPPLAARVKRGGNEDAKSVQKISF